LPRDRVNTPSARRRLCLVCVGVAMFANSMQSACPNVGPPSTLCAGLLTPHAWRPLFSIMRGSPDPRMHGDLRLMLRRGLETCAEPSRSARGTYLRSQSVWPGPDYSTRVPPCLDDTDKGWFGPSGRYCARIPAWVPLPACPAVHRSHNLAIIARNQFANRFGTICRNRMPQGHPLKVHC
jgi:hypothetical protein